jgi:hypothetical protein
MYIYVNRKKYLEKLKTFYNLEWMQYAVPLYLARGDRTQTLSMNLFSVSF